METKELTKMVCDLAAAENIHPLKVLWGISKLLSGGDDQVRQRINRDVHVSLYEIRNTIPWQIEPPRMGPEENEDIK